MVCNKTKKRYSLSKMPKQQPAVTHNYNYKTGAADNQSIPQELHQCDIRK
jgi:hypothetical protein